MHTAPLIDPVPPLGEEARAEAVFAAVAKGFGFVPDGLRLYGISPPLLETFVGTVGYFHSAAGGLPAELATIIRYLLSSRAGCAFCIDMNEARLVAMGHDLDTLRAARSNPEAAPVKDAERPLVRLALKAVSNPDGVTAADLDAARKEGWPDRVLFDTVALAANNTAFTTLLRTFKVHQQGAWS
jgi:alkylhydroperoxidase family enzyme